MASVNMPPETQICASCRAEKPFGEFWRDITRPSGRSYRCRDCERTGRRVGASISAPKPRGGGKSLRVRAWRAINRAVASGQIQRPATCFHCSEPRPLEAHHYLGYEPQFWLEVQWLCKECHERAHVHRPFRNWFKGWKGAA